MLVSIRGLSKAVCLFLTYFRTCGLDDTCILCSYCYNPEDHQGHQVIINISARDSGGVCDCGDPEAWVNHFSCKHHEMKNFSNNPISEDLETSLLATIETALDYVIDVLSNSDITTQVFKSETQVMEHSRISELSTEVYGVQDKPQYDKFVLNLWNDQRHSFKDVINMLNIHLNKPKHFGKMIATQVDAYGRGKIDVSTNLGELLRLKSAMESTRLVFTIRSAKDDFREDMCDAIIYWLEDISKISIENNYFIVRELISKALCSPWNVGNAIFRNERDSCDTDLIPKVSTSLNGASIPELGSYPPQFPPLSDIQKSPPVIGKSESVPEYWLDDGPDPPSFSRNGISARVQYLIYFDIRLWKSLRVTLNDLYISVLISHPEYKNILGHCYAQLYLQVVEHYILVDREPEVSIFSSLSTQLFTSPKIATSICQYNYFSKFMAGLYTLFTQFRVGPVTSINTKVKEFDIATPVKNRRFTQLFHDFEYILKRNTNKSLVTGNKNRINQLCDFLILFQGILPMVREKDSHVEYEPDLWISYFSCLPSVLQLAKSIAVGVSESTDDEIDLIETQAISTIASAIYNWSLGSSHISNTEIASTPFFQDTIFDLGIYKAIIRDVPIRIENDATSLHHPLHSFLSWIIQHGVWKSPESIKESLLKVISKTSQYSEKEHLSILFDFPMRTVVLLSQIRIGLWVRNGISVRNQMTFYRDMTLRDYSFNRDIFMLQTALVTMDPQVAFLQLLDRWGFLGLSINSAFDEEQKLYMVEALIHHLIALLVERHQLIPPGDWHPANNLLSSQEPHPSKETHYTQEFEKRYIFQEIIQCLGFGPLSFSDIANIIPDYLIINEMFEPMLLELCTFKPPIGIRDTGKYELKSQYFKYFDTRYLHFASSKIYDAENIIKAQIHKQTKKPLESIVIEPYLDSVTSGAFQNIGGFTRTPAFASFVFNILTMAIGITLDTDKGVDSILGLILHLCHAAALDDLERKTPGLSFVSVLCQNYEMSVPNNWNFPPEMSKFANPAALLFYLSFQSNFAHFKPRILRIFEILKTKDGNLVDSVLSPIFSDSYLYDTTDKDSVAEKPSKSDLQKIAKRKKKKALEKIQKQQQRFAKQLMKASMEEVADDDKDMTDEDAETEEWHFSGSQCILCHIPCDEKKIFGIVAHSQISNAYRTVPFQNPDWVMEAYGMEQDLCVEESESKEDVIYHRNDTWNEYREKFSEKNVIGPGFPKGNNYFRPVISSCCHAMHLDCYTSYLKSASNRPNELTRNNPDNPRMGEILCPLCRSLNNTFIPILWKSTNRDSSAELKQTFSFSEFVEKAFSQEVLNYAQNPQKHSSSLFKQCVDSASPIYAPVLGLDGSPFSPLRNSNLLKELDLSILAVDRTIIREWGLVFQGGTLHTDTISLDMLFKCLAGTITDIELSLRGLKTSAIFLEQLTPLTVTLLQVLIEFTALSVCYSVTDVFKNTGNSVSSEMSVFVPFQSSGDLTPFEELVTCLFYYSPAFDLDKVHFIKGYLLKVLVNSLTVLIGELCDGALWTKHKAFASIPIFEKVDEETIQSLSQIVLEIRKTIRSKSVNVPLSNAPAIGHILYTMLIKSVTPFLRKTAIFIHARCTKGFNTSKYKFSDSETEADRLCQLLKVPTISSLIKEISHGVPGTFQLASKFIRDHVESSTSPKIDYPAIQKLISLPHRLDQFFTNQDLWMKNTESVEYFSEPAVCLFCCQTVNLQSPTDISGRGPCNNHCSSCGKSIGMFILPKRSSLLFLTRTQGSFYCAPYLDVHGEEAENYKRQRPQYLSQMRYNHIQRVFWLQHGIPDYISRMLYSNIDVGGWETL